MSKSVTFTCDAETTEPHDAAFVVHTELQNGSTVFYVDERHTCDDPLHVGLTVTKRHDIVAFVQEATAKNPSGSFPADKWQIRAVRVTPVSEAK